jgi:hypothetical protein
MASNGCVDLANLLTAAGVAAGTANARLLVSGAPALLREFTVELRFDSGFAVTPDATALLLTRPHRPNPQMQAMMRSFEAGVRVQAHYIAAPSVQPVPPT